MLNGGGCTDLGRTRPINEDGYYISDYNKECEAIYAVVADGMGGHQAGEVASTMAICEIRDAVNERCFGGMTGSSATGPKAPFTGSSWKLPGSTLSA